MSECLISVIVSCRIYLRFFAALSAFTALALVAGCAGTGSAPQERPVQQLAPLESGLGESQAVLNVMLAQPLVPSSVFREGDLLSFQVDQPLNTDILVPSHLQVEAACSAPQVGVKYTEFVKRSYFGKLPGNYSEGISSLEAYHPILEKNPAFREACSHLQVPDWRTVQAPANEPWLLIDVNSLEHKGDQITFWTAYDSPTLTFMWPHGAPHAQSREHLSVDCRQHTYSVTARYSVDRKNSVTDGIVYEAPPVFTLAGDADHGALAASACSPSTSLMQLPHFSSRAKPLSDAIVEPLGPLVVKAASALVLPATKKSFHHVQITTVSSSHGAITKDQVEIDLAIEPATGLLSSRSHWSTGASTMLSVRGMSPLSVRYQYANGQFSNMTSTSVSFTGDWEHMEVGKHLTSTQWSEVSSTDIKPSAAPSEVFDCKVERDMPATELDIHLTGAAKSLSCSTVNRTALSTHSQVIYLMDYGYFFVVATQWSSGDTRVEHQWVRAD